MDSVPLYKVSRVPAYSYTLYYDPRRSDRGESDRGARQQTDRNHDPTDDGHMTQTEPAPPAPTRDAAVPGLPRSPASRPVVLSCIGLLGFGPGGSPGARYYAHGTSRAPPRAAGPRDRDAPGRPGPGSRPPARSVSSTFVLVDELLPTFNTRARGDAHMSHNTHFCMSPLVCTGSPQPPHSALCCVAASTACSRALLFS